MNIIKKKKKSLRLQNKLFESKYAVFYNIIDLNINKKQSKNNKSTQLATDLIMSDNFTQFNNLNKESINGLRIVLNKSSGPKYLFAEDNILKNYFVGNMEFFIFSDEVKFIDHLLKHNFGCNIIVKYNNRYIYLTPIYKKLLENKALFENGLKMELIFSINGNLLKWLYFYNNIYIQSLYRLKNLN
uniref:Uncharacterized protein n=1 Tax=Cyanophora biloba TaxID=1489483 RepID=A0A873WYK1_9EUKA|nr:hypothetical protein DXZ13_mgp21 [Cyanophora biloba]QPB15018.1 hypothetical protein [Cyanophora biloba]